uniref:BZIP domain-containing protein n=1 Tax=Romanomermis culicivorax TaxID=13658 RepID=A0A915JX11_ROMCU
MEENLETSDFCSQPEPVFNNKDPLLTSKWSSSLGSDSSIDDAQNELEALEDPMSPLSGNTINDCYLDRFAAYDQNTNLSDDTFEPSTKKRKKPVEIRIIPARKRCQPPQPQLRHVPVGATLEIETSTVDSQRRAHTSIYKQNTAQSQIVPVQSGSITPIRQLASDSAVPIPGLRTDPTISTLNRRRVSESLNAALAEFVRLEPGSVANSQNAELKQKSNCEWKMTSRRKSHSLSKSEKQVSAHSREYRGKRDKNNDAVKRCREKKKREDEQKTARLARLEIENKKLQEDNATLTDDINMLRGHSIDFYAEIEMYRRENEIYRRENEILKNDKQFLEENNEDLQHENECLKAKINELASDDLVETVSCLEAERHMLDICGNIFDVSASIDGKLSSTEDFPFTVGQNNLPEAVTLASQYLC